MQPRLKPFVPLNDSAPTRSRPRTTADTIALAAVCLTGLLLFAAFSTLVLTKPITQDEGVFLTIGKFLNHGWLPYRDLFDHKPPGIYFLFAALFKLFGTNIFVIKVSLILSTVVTTVLIGKIGALCKPGSGRYAALLFLFMMTQFEGYFLIAEPFLLLPLLLSLWLLLREPSLRPWVFLAGVALAIATLFKQTALLSGLPLLILARKKTKHGTLLFLSGFGLPWLLLGGYCLVNGLLADAWHQVVTVTLTNYPRESLGYVLRSLQANFLWTLPVLILLTLGITVSARRRATLWALVLMPLPLMFFRHYPHYWVQVLPFIALIAAATLVHWRSRELAAATLVFCLAIAGGKVAQDAASNQTVLHEQLSMARVLQEVPVDAVLAENQYTGFSFLLPAPPLNKYLYITEITASEQAEQQTIADLRSKGTTMILWPADPNYAYAQQLQAEILTKAVPIASSSTLGLLVMTTAASTGSVSAP